jgi:guanine deaminase
MPSDRELLEMAIDEARQSVREGGGPFGAIVVLPGNRELARGRNRVTLHQDPTAHAEVIAIRAACQMLGNHRLQGATIYSSTEPCPMCLAAIHWARIDRLVYGATRHDAARAGFDDATFYRELQLPPESRALPATHLALPSAQVPLDEWVELGDKTLY